MAAAKSIDTGAAITLIFGKPALKRYRQGADKKNTHKVHTLEAKIPGDKEIKRFNKKLDQGKNDQDSIL